MNRKNSFQTERATVVDRRTCQNVKFSSSFVYKVKVCLDRISSYLMPCFVIVTLTLIHDGRAVKINVVMFTLEIRILLSAENPQKYILFQFSPILVQRHCIIFWTFPVCSDLLQNRKTHECQLHATFPSVMKNKEQLLAVVWVMLTRSVKTNFKTWNRGGRVTGSWPSVWNLD